MEVSGTNCNNGHRYHPLAPLRDFGMIKVFL